MWTGQAAAQCSPPVVRHPGECGARHVHPHHLRLHRGPVGPVLAQPLGALGVVELAGELLVVTRLERTINDISQVFTVISQMWQRSNWNTKLS